MNAYGNHMLEGKAQELVEKLYLAAKRNKTRRFHVLYDKVYRIDFLESAWKTVKRNRGSQELTVRAFPISSNPVKVPCLKNSREN